MSGRVRIWAAIGGACVLAGAPVRALGSPDAQGSTDARGAGAKDATAPASNAVAAPGTPLDPPPYVAAPAASSTQDRPPPSGPITKNAPSQAKSTTAAPPPPLPQARALAVRSTLSKDEITLGEPFVLTIEVTHPPDDAYALPGDLAGQLDKGKLKPSGDPAVQRDRVPQGAHTTFAIPLVVLASMEPAIPEITLLVQGPEGPRALTVQGQALKVKSLVKAEGAPNDEHAHHGPKPPVAVMERAYLWAWILVGLAAVVGAAFALRKLLARKKEAVIEAIVVEAPETIALRRLDDLRRRAPWKSGQSRAAIFERSEIVRTYLGQRLAFNAIDLTSDELLAQLRERKPAGLDVDAIASRLAWEDLVKFAKMEPQPGECEAAMDEAQSIVEALRPALETTRSSPIAQPQAPQLPEVRA